MDRVHGVWTRAAAGIRGTAVPHRRVGARGRRCSSVVAGEDEVELVRGSPEHELRRRGGATVVEDSIGSSPV
jgi:hypothetical protein